MGKGINSNARERAIVIHGAEYVSSSFIQNNKRLGRSLGCPSLPMNLSSEIIQTIKDKSCLFIYYPSNSYKVASKLIFLKFICKKASCKCKRRFCCQSLKVLLISCFLAVYF
jgi:hypothetical protein